MNIETIQALYENYQPPFWFDADYGLVKNANGISIIDFDASGGLTKKLGGKDRIIEKELGELFAKTLNDKLGYYKQYLKQYNIETRSANWKEKVEDDKKQRISQIGFKLRFS